MKHFFPAMRTALLLFIISFSVISCSKDKFTTSPQLRYKSLTSNRSTSTNFFSAPDVILNITDKEGDLGFTDRDTAFVYITNLQAPYLSDSFPFPHLNGAAGKKFDAELRVNLFNMLTCTQSTRPSIDTFFFEIYVRDFARNKSNVIVTPDPFYYECQ